MKKLLTLVSTAIIAASILVIAQSPLRAQDDDPFPDPDPPDTDVELAIPPTSPDAQKISHGFAIVDYSALAEEGTPENLLTEKTDEGKGDKLPGLLAEQVVHVTQQFDVTKVGHTIEAVALDGGSIQNIENDLVVAEDGTIDFDFQVGSEPGLYQVALRDDSEEVGLQFWVINQENPRENPAINVPMEEPPYDGE